MQVLYEIAYAFGSVTGAFSIFTRMPKSRVCEDKVVDDINSDVLMVEEDGGSREPLLFFSSSEVHVILCV